MKQFDGLQSLQQPLSGLPQWVSERILQQITGRCLLSSMTTTGIFSGVMRIVRLPENVKPCLLTAWVGW